MALRFTHEYRALNALREKLEMFKPFEYGKMVKKVRLVMKSVSEKTHGPEFLNDMRLIGVEFTRRKVHVPNIQRWSERLFDKVNILLEHQEKFIENQKEEERKAEMVYKELEEVADEVLRDLDRAA